MNRRWLLLIPATLLALAGASILFLRSEWLRERLRQRIVAEVERATGGSARLQSFEFDWTRFEARARSFQLRGTEPAARQPLFSAETITLGLNVRSWLARDVELRSLSLSKPAFHLYVAEDGSTNLPHPKIPTAPSNPIADLLKLHIGQLHVYDGVFYLDDRRVPLELNASGLLLHLTYDQRKPLYHAAVRADAIDLPFDLHPRLDAQVELDAAGLRILSARAELPHSRADVQGALADLRQPNLKLDIQAAADLRDIPLSPVRQGRANTSATLLFDPNAGLRLNGTLRAHSLAYSKNQLRLANGRLTANYQLTPTLLTLSNLAADTPLGSVSGSARLARWRALHLEGQLTRLDLDALQRALLDKPYPWRGLITGPVTLDTELTSNGPAGTLATAALDIAPAEGALPVSGQLNLLYRQAADQIEFDNSRLSTPGARLNFAGVFGRSLQASLFATRLSDLQPVLRLVSGRDDLTLPLELHNGEARLDATLSGPLRQPEIDAKLHLTNAVFEETHFPSASAQLHVTRDSLSVRDLRLRLEGADAAGQIQLGLRDWQHHPQSSLAANLSIQTANAAPVARLLHLPIALSGAGTAEATIQGTLGMPVGQLKLTAANATAGAERFDRAQALLTLAPSGELKGSATLDKARLELSGTLKHAPMQLRGADLTLSLSATGIALKEWQSIQALKPGIDSQVAAALRARFVFEDETTPRLKFMEGSLKAAAPRIGASTLGDLTLTGATTGDLLRLNLSLGLPTGAATGEAQIRLAGDYPASGSLQWPRLGFGLVHDLLAGADSAPWPMRGFLLGELKFNAPLADLARGSADLTIEQFQLRPRSTSALGETSLETTDLTLRNNGPLRLHLDSAGAHVSSARFSALETNLTASGLYAFHSRSPWNAALAGNINLAVLSAFRPDLIAAGSARLDATIRGASDDPQLSGRMAIQNASLYLKDLPNGIENASGTVYFEKQRANIEKLSGQTGGGSFQINGFVGFRGDELTYRLQAAARTIRVRYPEGVSTTLDADLSLTGSSARSLLAGNLTVQRAGFTANGDIASMVGSSGNPIPVAATQNEFLRNLLFDIRIRTAPDAVFQSSYTRDLETEADLHLRGSPAKPILLGSIKANQGGIQFFGNRYTVSRGEVLFYNTAVVQPSIDLDLETRVRGVTVYINVSGPLNRLNISYRSEPPLQSSEILALLTVGRSPSSTSTSVTASQSIRNQTVMENSPNSLLGGALSAGVSSRVERFFGSSRIKIDPNFTGVENLPQARLSVEQSISRDITLTFITNLNRSQQQVVRLEWDLNKQWSVIAVKDENGSFAVDFLFRRRFK